MYILGKNSGLNSGKVKYTNVDEYSIYFGLIYDQICADYDAVSGNSGAPILLYLGSVCFILGIHVGNSGVHSGYELFSPINGIGQDLNVRPLLPID